MLHFWLIPAIAIAIIILWSFYATVKNRGGSGIRSEGRTMVDKPAEEEDDHLSS
ncbi:MAG TPA: hypothetical protein VFM25_06355 [Verrucomicrobiae bacterium]|nr:hypothetical protein [Verrucomicrobiae bacterium]